MKCCKKRRSAGSSLSKGVGSLRASLTHRRRRVDTGRTRQSELSREERWEIISSYFDSLERMKGALALESHLPFKKDVIRLAILQEMVENPNVDLKNLEIAYVQLESFLPRDEYLVIAKFKDASLRVQEIIESEDPIEIIKSAGMIEKVEGDRAVSIQERISEKIQQRMAEIQEIVAAGSGRTCIVGDAELICV